jgi:hypothetical protein
MTFKIVIEINENDARVDDVRQAASYIGRTLKVMGHSYSMDCLMNDMKLAMKEKP